MTQEVWKDPLTLYELLRADSVRQLETPSAVLAGLLAGHRLFWLADTYRRMQQDRMQLQDYLRENVVGYRTLFVWRAFELSCPRTGGLVRFVISNYDDRVVKVPDWYRGVKWDGGVWW